MVKILFFGTPYDGENGWKRLQHTFLDQPNTFCFMNFAQKLSAELRSDKKKVTLKGKNMHPHHIKPYVCKVI
jgi:hypothetical protein